jgi:hypothetical protein
VLPCTKPCKLFPRQSESGESLGLVEIIFFSSKFSKKSSKIKDTARRWKLLISHHINPLTQLEKSIWHPSPDHV